MMWPIQLMIEKTAKGKVIGANAYGPIIYIDDASAKKHKKFIDYNCTSRDSGEDIDSSFQDLDLYQQRFFHLDEDHKYAFNKEGEPRPKSPLEEKFGVKLGDRIKILITKQNRLCTTTKSTTGKFAIGKVIGGDAYNVQVYIEDPEVRKTLKNLQVMYDDEVHSKFANDEDIEFQTASFHTVYSKKCFEKVEELDVEKKDEFAEKQETKKEIKMELKVSYTPKLGDKVWVERDCNGRLIDDASIKPDTTGKYPPVLCTLVANGNNPYNYSTVITESSDKSIGVDATGYVSYADEAYKHLMTSDRRAWNLHTYKPKPIEVFGLKVGDEVEVGQKSNGALLENAGKWSKSVKGKVIGFEIKNNVAYPLIYIEGDLLKKKHKIKYSSIDKNNIFPQFLNDKSIDTENGCFWYVYGENAIKKIERYNGVKMNNNVRPEFWDMMKDNGTSALYRIAATQGTKGVKAAIL